MKTKLIVLTYVGIDAKTVNGLFDDVSKSKSQKMIEKTELDRNDTITETILFNVVRFLNKIYFIYQIFVYSFVY